MINDILAPLCPRALVSNNEEFVNIIKKLHDFESSATILKVAQKWEHKVTPVEFRITAVSQRR